jgi:SAM-dependent methyltransferase
VRSARSHAVRGLGDQANTLAELLHAGTSYPPGSRVLEVGCGVGAQTVHLVTASPGAQFVAVDISDCSLAAARARVAAATCSCASCYHPASARAQAAIDCLVQLQAAAGGDSLIGRQLQPLLTEAGYEDVVVRPRTVYADEARPELVDGFTRNTFIAMVEAVGDDALAAGLTTSADWRRGIDDLRRTADQGGTFHYTFFKAAADRVYRR